VVLRAARELLAEGGIDALSMRALAGRLQVAPNAIYSHVESKTGLLDELLDDTLAEVHAPPATARDPVAAIARLMTSTYDVLVARPDLVALYLSRQGARGPNAIRLGERMDALLVRAGVTVTATAEARRVLIVHTIGFAAFATGAAIDPDPARPISATESRRNFDRGLRWLLAGIVGAPPG
jgi:TetR/AcrR family tetracycline transcriptional repressor